jgi:divalent metal cation (Fe/Co/Zn/Cd) transporter
LKIAGLWGGLKVKVQAVETAAFHHRTPDLASLGKILHVVGNHCVGIKRVSALLTIAIGIV